MPIFQDHEARILDRGIRRASRKMTSEQAAKANAVLDDPEAFTSLQETIAADVPPTPAPRAHPILDAIANLINNPEKLIALLEAFAKMFGLG